MNSTAILQFLVALIFVSDCHPMQVVQGKTNPGIRLRVTNNGLQYGKCFQQNLLLKALTHRISTSLEILLSWYLSEAFFNTLKCPRKHWSKKNRECFLLILLLNENEGNVPSQVFDVFLVGGTHN